MEQVLTKATVSKELPFSGAAAIKTRNCTFASFFPAAYMLPFCAYLFAQVILTEKGSGSACSFSI